MMHKPKKSSEEILAIFKAVREEYQALNPGRDPLAELIAERRAEGLERSHSPKTNDINLVSKDMQ